MPANGYLSPEEDEQTDSFPDNPVQSSLRRVQSSKTTRSLQVMFTLKGEEEKRTPGQLHFYS